MTLNVVGLCNALAVTHSLKPQFYGTHQEFETPPGFLDLPTNLSHKNDVTNSLKPQFYGTHQEIDAYDSKLFRTVAFLLKHFNYNMYI